MRHGYKTILPSQWLAWRNSGTPMPSKAIMLTFDDGYVDVAQYALPILERYGLKAAIFVVTGLIGGTNRWDERRGMPSLKLMTQGQIRHWAAKGMEFGSHSRSHRGLTTLDESELDSEVDSSKLDLERITGAAVLSFAYPYGHYNRTVRRRVREQFPLGFSSIRGLNGLLTSRDLLRRIPFTDRDSPHRLAWLLRKGLRPADYVRKSWPALMQNPRWQDPAWLYSRG